MQETNFDFEKAIADLEHEIAELKRPERRAQAEKEGIDLTVEVGRMENALQLMMVQHYSHLTAWEKTQMARYKDRPYTLDYFRLIFDEFMELSGDRLAGNDEAIVGGLAKLNGEPVVVVGHQKGRDLKERQRRNFGSARPEGFRKALRLAKLAEKFGKPLLCFVDTPAAAADLRAEELGISEAIAHNLREFALLETPVIVAIIGEGGSGGALGLAIGDRVVMLEHAVYSVIPPEGCAAILWHDKTRGAEAAEALRLTAQDAKAFGLIDEILPEPLGGAHRDMVGMATALKQTLCRHLSTLGKQPLEDLVAARYTRLRCMGVWEE